MKPHLLATPLLPDALLEPWVTAEEAAEAMRFGSERRRRERLTWRALARQQLGAEVRFGYDAVGAPEAIGRPERLSVSHTVDRVVILLSDRPCAIDIERTDRRLEAVFRRLLTPAEAALSTDALYPTIACCAKECLYKYGHDRTLQLQQDLQLEAIEPVGAVESIGAVGTVEAVEQVGVIGTVGSSPASLPEPIRFTGAEPLRPHALLTARIRGGAPLRLVACRLGAEHLLVYLT